LKKDEQGHRHPFIFDTNNLIIEDVNCDEGLVPVDKEIEASLNRSLSLSFEIQNKSQKQAAQHNA
jgi:hypothetical protein